MAGSNPVYYKDLIHPDDSIEQLIKQLTEVKGIYDDVTSLIKKNATEIQSALKGISGATAENRETIGKYANDAAKLERQFTELSNSSKILEGNIQGLNITKQKSANLTKQEIQFIESAKGSYKEMEAELKLVTDKLKSMTQEQALSSNEGAKLINRIIELKDRMRAYDDAIKLKIQSQIRYNAENQAANASESARKTVLAEMAALEEKLAFAKSEENVQLKLYTQQIREANQEAKLQAQIANSAEGSYNRLSAQYSLNKIKLNQMSKEMRSSTEEGKALEKQTAEIYAEMIRLQEATGNYRLSVGNYARSWNGLGVAVSQVVRELPAAAVSLNTFFLGISNNIPILMDEINRLIAQNKILQQQGMQTVSVSKAIVKSLFSFNTILVILLTVFSMYGKQITEFIGRMFAGTKVTNDYKTELQKLIAVKKNLLDADIKGQKNATREIVHLKLLKKQAENTNLSYKERIAAVNELQKTYPSYFGNVSKEAILNGQAKDSYGLLAKSILNAARAKAYEDKIVENTNKIIDLRTKKVGQLTNAELTRRKAEKLKQEGTTGRTAFDVLAAGSATAGGANYATQQSVAIQTLTDNVKLYGDQAQATEDQIQALVRANTRLAISASKLNIAGPDTKGIKGREPRPRDTEDTLDSLSRQIHKSYAKSITDLEREELENQRRDKIDAYNAEVADLYAKYNKIQRIIDGQDSRYKTLTKEQMQQAIAAQEEVVKATENMQSELTEFLERQWYARQEKQLSIEGKTTELLLKSAKKDTQEELTLRLKLLEIEKKIALAKNKQLPKSEQQNEADIIAGYNKDIDLTMGEYNLYDFDKQQEVEATKYEITKRSENRLTSFRLKQEQDRWKKLLSLSKSGMIEMSDAEIEIAENTIARLDREISEADDVISRIGERGAFGGILEAMGLDDDQIEALEEAVSVVIDNIKSIADAEVEAAEKALDAQRERVDMAKKVYETELEARANGYANNTAIARKELEEEKKRERQKEQMLIEAQRRQEAINSLTQASSLITASANIWSSLSVIPIIGPALALAAIGTMWTSFAAAKIRARQVTQQEEEYGEGGIEFLEGGSHASGNDIDLGVKNKKNKRMKAEGGEALIVINKRKTSKYKKMLPSIVDSLNKGNFEDRFVNAFSSADDISISSNQRAVDLSYIEDQVEQIKKQGERKLVVKPDGSIVEIDGKTIRLIK
jgi:hypothetical protein